MAPGNAATLAVAGLRWQWTLAFVVGELIGFIPPAVTGATLAALDARDVAFVVGLTLAGIFEGAAIGVTQARVLARYAPAIDRPRWVIATAAAAGFAWFIGMGGSALMSTDIAPAVLLAVLLAPAWGAALLAMGYSQWRVLRTVVPNSRRWVWVTASAWLLGVMIPVAALSLAPNSWPAWAHVIVGVLAATAMGLTVGMLTGNALAGLLQQRRLPREVDISARRGSAGR